MNIMVRLFVLFVSLSLFACGNNENKSPETVKADSLFRDVMDGHDIGMAKMGRLTRAEQTARRMLDSIQKLPSRAREAAEPLRVRLDSLQKDLSYAEFAMNKWMNEFNIDSAVGNVKQRIEYLESEKIKVQKVKEAIVGGLEKADSILKDKF